jgi:hypothetical protein
MQKGASLFAPERQSNTSGVGMMVVVYIVYIVISAFATE